MALTIATLGDYRRKGLLMLCAGGVFGASLVAFALRENLYLSLAVLVVVGAASMMNMATNNVLIQMLVPDEVRGRVMGIYMLTWAVSPLGSLPAGVLGYFIGVPAVLAIGGAITTLCAFATMFLFPAVRKM